MMVYKLPVFGFYSGENNERIHIIDIAF